MAFLKGYAFIPQMQCMFCYILHIMFYMKKLKIYLYRALLEVNGQSQEASTNPLYSISPSPRRGFIYS